MGWPRRPFVGQYLNLDVAQLVTERTVVGLSVQGGRVFDLRLDDAIERALARNLDIAVERLNPQIRCFRHQLLASSP